MPDGSHACPNCGAGIAPAPVAAQRTLPPRPPPEPPRPWWRTAADWTVLAVVCALVGTFFYRLSNDADQIATEKKEVAREKDHLVRVGVWDQDTTGNVPVPESAGRPVPTSARAKRMWVISRMAVEGTLWRQEIMKRHGLTSHDLPAAWATARYQANARSYPEVGKHLEGRVAALKEIEKTAAAWAEERTLALARESKLPPGEIREIFPSDFVRMAPGEMRLSEALLELHRHLVRIDPRVRHAGGTELRFEREQDVRRLQELAAAARDASAAAAQGRQTKLATEAAALSRVIR